MATKVQAQKFDKANRSKFKLSNIENRSRTGQLTYKNRAKGHTKMHKH